jgi:uncharacterized protein (DUF2336 family)
MTEEPIRQKLSASDVQKLMVNPSAETRVETTSKIAGQFASGELSPSERKIAEDIFRTLVRDTEIRVRESLAAHLKSSPDLPHDVAVSLAKDVDSVALPVIKFSEVLTDQDLIGIVRGNSAARQVAVAQRPRVSAVVADALIDTGNETAVARLVSNEGAELTEKALGRVMSEYEASDSVSDSLSRRATLPAAVAEQLVEMVTQKLQDYLAEKEELPADVASNLILQARERATMSLAQVGSTEAELDNLIVQLHRKRRLSHSLLLRALCVGDIGFFERALSKLANLPLQNTRILIHDQGKLGLESVYLKAGLPKRWYPVFRAGVDLSDETDYDGGPNDRNRYVSKMLERMLTNFEDPSSSFSREDIDYLMGKLEQIAA